MNESETEVFEAFESFDGNYVYVQVHQHAALNSLKARDAAAIYWGVCADELEMSSVFMREVFEDEAMEASYGESEYAWIECDPDDEGATPFYKADG